MYPFVFGVIFLIERGQTIGIPIRTVVNLGINKDYEVKPGIREE